MMGLGFIHLGFLAAGAAVAVPIIIHLIYRQRPRRIDLGTLQFLRVVLRDHARRRNLKRYLLLALRIAGVLLLALLFARPYRSAAGTLGTEREVVLLIDRSASMGAGDGGTTSFERAQQHAADVISELPDECSVRLAYFDANGVEAAAVARIDPALHAGLAATDYTQALEWARDIVVASRRLTRQVFLFTDLQRSGLRAPLASGFPPSAQVELYDVGRPLTANLAVFDAVAEHADIRDGQSVTIAAQLSNAGLLPARDVRVRLQLEGQAAIEKKQTLAGHSRLLVRFDVPIKSPGLYHGFVEVIAGDNLPFDDRRYIAFEARLPDRVLLVDGEPGRSVYGDETYYLETALRLKLAGDEPTRSSSPYEPVHIPRSGSEKPLTELKSARVVALCNVDDVTPAEADALARFVEAGGGLIVFTGDRVKIEAYGALERAKVLPARIQGPVAISSYRFADWVKDHPVLSRFADPQYGDLRSLKFRRITRLVPERDARVLATTSEGAPLVVEKTVGRGKCIVFAFPADNAWGEWAVHRLYVPLVHQLLGDLTHRLPETSLVRHEPAGQDPAHAAGVTMKDGSALVRNVDTAESEIERTTEVKLREFYRLPQGLKRDAQPSTEPDPLAAANERPDELWRTVAWALLTVLVAEMFIANRTSA
jgi:Aerotolerance regulator N-terminal/von Willebrand factor type A domain